MATTSMDYEATGERYDGKSPVASICFVTMTACARARVMSPTTLYELFRPAPTTRDQC
jgi:hypothetical protein